VPTVSAAVSNDYVMSLLAALRPDDPGMPLESDDVAVAVATSGSTGAPRGVLLTAEQLTWATAVIHGPDAHPQWVAALPVTSMGGLNVLIRALATEREPVVVPSIGGAGPFTSRAFADAVAIARSRSSDVRTSQVPAQLARLLADEEGIHALRECSAVLVGGGPTRPSLLEAARDLGVPVITTYGATETAGGCVLDGRPLPGVTVSADGTPGVLTITGPCVAWGYRGEPAVSREVLSGGRFRTSDVGVVAADGQVTVLGRADDVVVIRGVNVSVGAVERAAADLPDVAAAAAVAVPGSDGEPHIHVFVEVRDRAHGVPDAVREAVLRTLGRATKPVVHEVARLPHLPNGKVDRRRLQRQAGED
jgi:O-succinylbenzoic acid--CoA ligase